VIEALSFVFPLAEPVLRLDHVYGATVGPAVYVAPQMPRASPLDHTSLLLLALSFPSLFLGHDVAERLSPFGDWRCRVS
jgi:hypothetical protein